MLKTYLYVPEELKNKIATTAQEQGKSKAEVMRLALQKGIKALQVENSASVDALFKLSQLGEKYKVTGPKDAVKNFDNYLYGRDWASDE